MHRKGGSAVIAVVLALAGMAATSSAAVYKVGGASGWTILGNVNYTDWAGKNTFHVGDIIEFKYPQGIHNVLEVKKADYNSCTNSTPIATHTSGDDKVTIKSPGHRFFICGVPSHCAAGQKLNVRVLKTQRPRSSDAPSPAPAASASAPAPAAASPRADGQTASTPPAASGTTSDGGATTSAPAPNANGAGIVSAGYPAFAALAVAVSMTMLQY
ncbi:blue copper protein-like [Lolium rigidum]|uniref:blue copper protein-like n=1 Tax=Lolium rigidum TaxID=89674 RepID=UPI001F5C506E|nr:blue copper protein-like [Lolium rigidum]